jgi:hypothetical protein
MYNYNNLLLFTPALNESDILLLWGIHQGRESDYMAIVGLLSMVTITSVYKLWGFNR